MPWAGRRKRWIILLVVACVLATLWVVAGIVVGPTVKRVHTEFLFGQFDVEYSNYRPVASERAFRDLIPQWNIDWNSCEFRDGEVLDSWDTPVRIRIDSTVVSLRSAGPDRLFDTSDDITRELGREPASQPTNP